MMGLVILWDDSFIFLVFVLWVSSCFNKQQAQPNWKVILCMMKKRRKNFPDRFNYDLSGGRAKINKLELLAI